MSKAFKKGQAVIHFQCYDRKGTWTYTRAIVKSCGLKKMTLETAEGGVMMGCNFRPDANMTYTRTYNGETIVRNWGNFTLADMTDEEAIAVCLERGTATIKDENEHFDCCEASSDNVHYLTSIRLSRSELHEPRALKR